MLTAATLEMGAARPQFCADIQRTENIVSTHQVKLAGSGKQFSVEAGETILSAALRQGVVLPYSCRNGTCASCRGKLVSGSIDYPYQPPAALSEEERASGDILLCQAVPQDDTIIAAREIDAVGDIPVRILPTRVEDKHQLAASVVRLRLRLPKGQRLQFLAGQYVDVLLQGGRRRSFSLASPPHDEEHLELHLRHVHGGDFTGYVFSEMPERAILRLEGPLGTFFVREDSPRPMLMMGGGTGFAPLKAMMEHLIHIGNQRPVHLFWGTRNRDELYLDELPRQWQQRIAWFQYTPVLSEPLPGDNWQGETGFVHEALLRHYHDLSGFDIYMSGPPIMINAARDTFTAHGLPLEQLYYDSFDFNPDPGGVKLKQEAVGAS